MIPQLTVPHSPLSAAIAGPSIDPPVNEMIPQLTVPHPPQTPTAEKTGAYPCPSAKLHFDMTQR